YHTQSHVVSRNCEIDDSLGRRLDSQLLDSPPVFVSEVDHPVLTIAFGKITACSYRPFVGAGQNFCFGLVLPDVFRYHRQLIKLEGPLLIEWFGEVNARSERIDYL